MTLPWPRPSREHAGQEIDSPRQNVAGEALEAALQLMNLRGHGIRRDFAAAEECSHCPSTQYGVRNIAELVRQASRHGVGRVPRLLDRLAECFMLRASGTYPTVCPVPAWTCRPGSDTYSTKDSHYREGTCFSTQDPEKLT